MLDGTEYFECTCGAPDHTLRFILDLEEDQDIPVPTLYTEVMLSHYQPWYNRIWIGIKYMFGYDKPDHFGCWELHQVDADRMISMLSKLKEANDKYLAERNLKMNNPSKTTKTDSDLYGGNDYEQST